MNLDAIDMGEARTKNELDDAAYCFGWTLGGVMMRLLGDRVVLLEAATKWAEAREAEVGVC